ncbi:hypothetical protein OHB13_38380 (plasmid) [Streptomyces sp. NBC_00440]|uniref:hypothetical protein n=1 Tax=Streptomyces sp. NBC_00440 TaxID=2975741 RepID=UPI002E1A4253
MLARLAARTTSLTCWVPLGLPCDEDDLVRLLPHLTSPNDPTTGDTMPVNAFSATAASMLKRATAPPASARPSESELAEALITP